MAMKREHPKAGVPARPREELHNLAKNIADCTELHLARRGITHLTEDMKDFESLEVLWVNNNSLSRITNLDFNPTIKSLYAHNNRIVTLKGSLLAFTFLHTLTLGNNLIENLQASLDTLRLMRHLRYLDLSGNPLAEETGYRLLMIKTLPWLNTLDKHKISDEERRAASRIRIPKSWEAESDGSHRDRVQMTQDLAEEEAKNDSWPGRGSGSVNSDAPSAAVARPVEGGSAKALLRKELGRMKAVVKKRRILLKEWFVAEDPRREGAVTQNLFTRCLRLHGLWPSHGVDALNDIDFPVDSKSRRSSTASSTGFLAGEAGLLGGILLEAFRVPAPPRAASLGRDAVYLDQSFIDYVSFCGAVEPAHGGRDVDNQHRVLEKAWKVKTKHPLSRMTLQVDHQPSAESQATHLSPNGSWENQMDTHMEYSSTDALPGRAPMACNLARRQEHRPGQLDHWEKIELKRVFEMQGGGGATSMPTVRQLLTRAQALSGLKKMVLQGRRPRTFVVEPLLPADDDSMNNLSGSGNGDGGGSGGGGGGAAQATTNSSSRTNLDILFDEAVAMTSSQPSTVGGAPAADRGRNGSKGKRGGGGGGSGGKGTGVGSGGSEGRDGGGPVADIGVLLRTMEEGVSAPGGVGPLEWDWLSCEEAGDKARKLYRQAAHAQQRLLLIPDDEDDVAREEASRIREKIVTLTRSAARLGALASSSPSFAFECLEGTGNGTTRGTGRSPSPPHVGRVDVFLASEFHGGPFHEQEERKGSAFHGICGSAGDAAAAASASQSGFDVSLTTSMSLASADRRTVRSGSGNGIVQRVDKPWFLKRVLTAG